MWWGSTHRGPGSGCWAGCSLAWPGEAGSRLHPGYHQQRNLHGSASCGPMSHTPLNVIFPFLCNSTGVFFQFPPSLPHYIPYFFLLSNVSASLRFQPASKIKVLNCSKNKIKKSTRCLMLRCFSPITILPSDSGHLSLDLRFHKCGVPIVLFKTSFRFRLHFSGCYLYLFPPFLLGCFFLLFPPVSAVNMCINKNTFLDPQNRFGRFLRQFF